MLSDVKSGSDLSLASACGRAAALVAALGLCACGLRSDAADDGSGGFETVSDTEEDPREGGCDMPYVLPFANFEARGRLLGPGKVRGWCGRNVEIAGDTDEEPVEPDAGPEDSYIVTPSFDVDVSVIISDADFEPSVRVTRDGCREDVLPQLCAAPVAVGAIRHFFAEVGHSYTISVDSPEGTDGRYTMQVLYGDPGIGACPIHPTQIDQAPGGFFTWSNAFGATPGEVDGRCGGPGDENMFQVNVSFPGTMIFRVTADDSFAPVLSLRSGCGAVTELQCTSSEQSGSSTVELVNFFPEPGTFFIVVDQGDVVGGSYKLEVFSE
jgi:hypothetical protein